MDEIEFEWDESKNIKTKKNIKGFHLMRLNMLFLTKIG